MLFVSKSAKKKKKIRKKIKVTMLIKGQASQKSSFMDKHLRYNYDVDNNQYGPHNNVTRVKNLW